MSLLNAVLPSNDDYAMSANCIRKSLRRQLIYNVNGL